MNKLNPVVGWTGAYTSGYNQAPYTEERKQALVDRIRKRKYNFTHMDHQFLDYAAPFYEDKVLCVLNKHEWDEAISEAYRDETLGKRLMPEDVIDRAPVDGVLYEKEKWEPKSK